MLGLHEKNKVVGWTFQVLVIVVERYNEEFQWKIVFMNNLNYTKVIGFKFQFSCYREEENEASAKLIIDAAAASEMETLRDKYTAAIEENNSLSVRVQTLERERLEGDEQVSKLKETVASQNREVSDLLAQVILLTRTTLSSCKCWRLF